MGFYLDLFIMARIVVLWRSVESLYGRLLVGNGYLCLNLPDHLILDVAEVIDREHLLQLSLGSDGRLTLLNEALGLRELLFRGVRH